MKLIKEEEKDHKTLAKEYKRLEIFITIFMSIAICLGTFYFNVICFGTECENKSPTPLIIIKAGERNTEKTSGENTESSATIDEKKLPDGAEYLRNTSDSIKINVTKDYYECVDVNIVDGQMVAKMTKYLRHFNESEGKETIEMDNSYNGTTRSFSIPNEKVKYIYSMYYQPGANSVVYVLCESGNVYTNNISVGNQSIDVLNNFKKTKHENVSDLVKVSVVNDTPGDGLPFEIDGLSNGNLSRIEIVY